MPRTTDVMVVQEDAVRNLNLALKSWEPTIKLHIDEPPPWEGGWAPFTTSGGIGDRLTMWMGEKGHDLGPLDEEWLMDLAEQAIKVEEEDIYSWLNDTPLPTPPIVPLSNGDIYLAVDNYVRRHNLCGCDICRRSLSHHVNRYIRTHPQIIADLLVEKAIEGPSL
jgi:hypothetical protein